MATFKELATTEKNGRHKAIFEAIAAHESDAKETEDGYHEIALDAGELGLIRDKMSEIVQDARAADGETQTAAEMKARLLSDFPAKIKARVEAIQAQAKLAKTPGIVQDGYANSVTGIGTDIDPGMAAEAFIPVSILPSEATAYYANGGIPQRIIDKKAGCLALDGVHFECPDMKPDDLAALDAYAEKCGFSDAYLQAATQALIFGGSVAYPVLEGDNPLSFQKGLEETLRGLRKDKGFIKWWVNADRWNCVFVPEYNITAQDYLYAKSLFIPLGGVRVNTERMAMARPRKLPFWGAIQQMGWATSDFEGWIKDFEAYQIMKMSLPIMAQQSSLMYHSFPADGLVVENGPDFAKKFFAENEKQMREWSMLHPRAINSVGEIKILERTYAGYRDLMKESALALCASSSVPESVLFAEKATGLASDNRDDVALKQSETIRLLFNNVAPSFKNCVKLLVASCFGRNSEQMKLADNVRIKPDSGVVLSDMDKAQLGQAFSAISGQFVAAGVPLASAVQIAKSFVPAAEIDEKTMEALGAGEAEGLDVGLWEALQAGRGAAPGLPFGQPSQPGM